MRTLSRLAVVASVLTLGSGTAIAAPQEAAAVNLLTSIGVKQLIVSAEPADHARLRDHFTALAARYTADAARHESMGRALTGNPNRRTGTTPNLHRVRLTALARESAVIVGELAAHHARLASGLPSNAPEGSAVFEEGGGAPAPRDEQMLELAAGARTPADHALLEEYVADLAARYDAETRRHTAMAAAYRGNPRSSVSSAATHCDRLVRTAREAGAEARAQASEHRSLATSTVR